MGKRRSARELALKFLYQTEFNKGAIQEQLDQFWMRLSIQDETRSFMKALVESTFLHLA